MAQPPAEESAEDRGRNNGKAEQDEPGIDLTEFERAHRVGKDNSPHRPPVDPPMEHVAENEQVDRDETSNSPSSGPAAALPPTRPASR